MPEQHFVDGTKETGPVLLPSKARCGVRNASLPRHFDWPQEGVCYCSDVEGQGVRNGLWHTIDLLSLPWSEDLWLTNSTEFLEEKLHLERHLDKIYINQTEIFDRGYVRTVVMKMTKGSFELKNLAREQKINGSEANAVAEEEEEEGEVRREWVVFNATADRIIEPRGEWVYKEGTHSTKVALLFYHVVALGRFGWSISSWENLTKPSMPRLSSSFTWASCRRGTVSGWLGRLEQNQRRERSR